jgi:hypothetical protein
MSEMNRPETGAGLDATGEVAYRPVSGWAVAGLLLGLASVFALAAPLLWTVPALGLAASAIALWRLSRPANVAIGHTAALCGLALALIFGTAAPSATLSNRWYLVRQADALAQSWFGYLRANEPAQAAQLLEAAGRRQTRSDQLEQYYQQSEPRKELRTFVDQPLVTTLLALGSQAEVRLYESADIDHNEQRDLVTLYYAVTRQQDGRPKTFFVKLMVDRSIDRKTRQPSWQILSTSGGARPPSMSD